MYNNIINNIILKSRMKIAVSRFEGEDIKMPKRSLPKLVATFVLATTVTGGLVYATGNTIYEKIWKQPESYSVTQNLTDEEKAKCISEEEAEEIGNNYLNKIGFDNETIRSLDLSKEFLENENIWNVYSEKVSMRINAESGKIKSLNIPTCNYKIPHNYGITREEARKVAAELLEKYRPEDDEGEYELISLKRNGEDKEAYIWYADFYKKYGDLINPAEKISIGWIPTINGLYSLSIDANAYENNEQKISKEEAIEIAIEKDKQIEKNRNIKDTKAEIRIKQMNENVYLRENFKEEYEKGILNNMEKIGENTYKLKDDAVMYKTEERVRKVWCVVIYYNTDEKMPQSAYTYYVDSTTGEIIGGNIWDEFANEDTLRNDPNNVIEK